MIANLIFGLRVHVIVRETESEAREAARELMSRLDEAVGKNIRERAQDVSALGVARQTEMRGLSNDDGYAEHIFSQASVAQDRLWRSTSG